MKQLFGFNLKKIRQEKGYSQEYLASLSEAQQSQISSYEKGTRWPSYRVIQALAKALECREEDFFIALDAKKEVEYIRQIEQLKQEIQSLKNAR